MHVVYLLVSCLTLLVESRGGCMAQWLQAVLPVAAVGAV